MNLTDKQFELVVHSIFWLGFWIAFFWQCKVVACKCDKKEKSDK